MSALDLWGPNQLPARYTERWTDAFDARLQSALVPGTRILDVGSGRRPTIPIAQRSAGTLYVGLDISASELQQAPPGSYDELHVADVAQRVPELQERFDLVVSWQVLEHVKPLAAALENLRSYLRPGGRMVVQFSGKFSAFALINAVVPSRLGVWAMHRLLGREPDTVFPAYYDRCWHGALKDALRPWSSFEIIPRYNGAGYFRFLPILQRGYVAYEEWAVRNRRDNLATHFLVVGIK